jgi:heptaprenyl diphosphate synthase
MNYRRTALLGCMVALAVALNIVERSVPSPVPWVRLGLANLLTLVAILSCGAAAGFTVTLLRIFVVTLFFGGFFGPGFFLSLGGGVSAATVMSLLAPGAWRLYSPLGISAAGACAHAVAQIIVLRFVLVRTWEVLYLLPWVLVPSLLTVILTGLLANFILLRRGWYLEDICAGTAEGR